MLQAPSLKKPFRQILHVDDDPSILRIVRKRLGDEGISVISLADSRQTIQTIQSASVQVVLLDIDMPHFDGIEVLKQIKSFSGNIQVIMLTGLISQLTAIEAMSNGAEYCIFKPIVDPSKLLHAIDLTFSKIDLWRSSLHELKMRRTVEPQTC